MTLQEARQAIAEKYNYDNWDDFSQYSIYDYDDIAEMAATLWQQSNLERIAFLERLSENFGKKEKELKQDIFTLNDRNEHYLERIKELEGCLKQLITNLESKGSDGNYDLWNSFNKAKELLK